MAARRRDTVSRETARDDAGDDRRGRVLNDPAVLERAKAALEAFRRGETPEGPGVGPDELPDFLREHP
jgi:hypothetical protein